MTTFAGSCYIQYAGSVGERSFCYSSRSVL